MGTITYSCPDCHVGGVIYKIQYIQVYLQSIFKTNAIGFVTGFITTIIFVIAKERELK